MQPPLRASNPLPDFHEFPAHACGYSSYASAITLVLASLLIFHFVLLESVGHAAMVRLPIANTSHSNEIGMLHLFVTVPVNALPRFMKLAQLIMGNLSARMTTIVPASLLYIYVQACCQPRNTKQNSEVAFAGHDAPLIKIIP